MEDWDELLARYFSGETTANEQEKAEAWLKKHPQEGQILKKAWEVNTVPTFAPDVNLAWSQVQSKITPVHHKENKLRNFNLRWAVAAVLVLAVGLAWWMLTDKDTDSWLTKEVQSKQTTPLLLSDGTKVWLNQQTKLRYPSSFDAAQREVFLEGEAFFEVKPNTQKPFVVHAAKTTTQVLGTSFNVKSPANEANIAVTVTSGKVAFFANAYPDKRLVLNKNQQGVFTNATQALTKNPRYDANLLAWKTGILRFERASLAEVAAVLSKYYNKTIKIENKTLRNCVLTTTLEKLSLKEAIEVIALTLNIEYTIATQQVVLKGKACK
ncbi:FecR family protein [Microscilla marina]|uniref:Putative anti-sigma factor n=1 Tax=Microscilla marina ATCC 23134 TaxID=313606 RepID=A1ZT47_MICM2|nr:FecR domain-containing protein [Microscilla marina]EAY26437.1 putative anti-sigma factor [Microscilla marina ATCC 23134]